MAKTEHASRVSCGYWKPRVRTCCRRIKSLQGDPHYVAVGMAAGVFVAFTPTLPFHAALTVYPFGKIRVRRPDDPAPVYDAAGGRVQFKDDRCAAESCIADVKEGIPR